MSLCGPGDVPDEVDSVSVDVGGLPFVVPVDVIDTYGESYEIDFDEGNHLPSVRAGFGPGFPGWTF